MTRIVYANLGYSRAIDGSLRHHVGRLHHHLYTPLSAQRQSLSYVRQRIEALDPDLCCLVEIDRGSPTNRYFDQFPELHGGSFGTARIDGKYGADTKLRRLSPSFGKSNAFFSRESVEASARYLAVGKKRLVYDIDLAGIRVLLVHFSLRYRVRTVQIAEVRTWLAEREGPTVVIGDFNAFRGPRELEPLLDGGTLFHANATAGPTFRLGPWRAALDTCLLSSDLKDRFSIEVIDQPFSDHQMLKIDIDDALRQAA
ncbi:endonuclease/exonuclease/phosphatase family protein [Aurantimonas sp. Leaf443]|uniref:endonuclease/exonuclease/phosphatase family protein n=1 Tax=Aurantimonas sp. Leaf443 TaxID=1736378 RepID=UPI0006FE0E13|nr:endonuclease/exonuclease/phosphatase family protein [Aurantimonas sp. Leaf443]KQT86264.1 hypothetical protein ASG48_06780 [Aurantimonas sp. Leaf443]